jgi:hypothetical protein
MRFAPSRALLLIGLAACRRDSPPRQPPASAATSAAVRPLGADSAAIEQVRARFTAHYTGAQGFGVDTLRARQSWFTPCLYSLLLADMEGDSARGGIGYLNWDPFTAAQDDATGFQVERATTARDTVLVQLSINYPGSNPSTAMTVATTQVDGQWRIANMVTAQANLARGLDSSLRAEAAAAHHPFAGCARR